MIPIKNPKYFQQLSEFPHSYFFIKKNKTLINEISPNKKNTLTISIRIYHLLSYFKRNHCGIFLTINDLCPDGLDLTDAILIIKSFEIAGVKFIIINIGINNFLIPKRKQDSNNAWLSSIAYLIENTSTPIYASGNFELTPQLIITAKRCGVYGLVHTSGKTLT